MRPQLRPGASSLVAIAGVAVLLTAAEAVAQTAAQVRLEARYTASIAGVPVGRGIWNMDIGEGQFSATASGRTAGVLSVFASGQGAGAVHGAITGGRLLPTAYLITVRSDKKTDEVRMALSGGNVKDFSAVPSWPPTPDRVPVTDADRRGVSDPMSAAILPVPSNGGQLTPETCHRTLPVFDGRGRYDIVLSFKRIEQVRAEKGYQGPAVVCGALYRPISGHRPSRPAIKYMIELRDMEIWFVPVAGTRVLAPFRVTAPTPLGLARLEATQFVTSVQAARVAPPKTH